MHRISHSLKLSTGNCARIAVDLSIVNASVLIGLVPYALSLHLSGGTLFDVWLPAALVLTSMSPLVFAAMGFYSKKRSYSGDNKAFVVLLASILLFAAAGVAVYLSGLDSNFPGAAFTLAWASCSTLLILARIWADLWEGIAIKENDQIISTPGEHPGHVLVTGGAGYVGSALLPKLLDKGYKVRLLDCFLYGESPIQSFIQHPNLEIHRGDFRNIDTVASAMKGMDSVIHLGGLVGDPACALDEELTLQINLIATRTIAQIAKGNGISRFVFASSCSVYGASDELLDEQSALNPVSLYARSKIASENILLNLRDAQFEPVILRFGTIYGLSGRTRFDLVVNLLAAKARIDGVITVFGKDQWRPFLHVHDASRAVIAALEAKSEAVSPTIFNVGCDEQNLTLGQVGEMIKQMVPGSSLVCTEENVDRRNYRVNFLRIRECLGFKPVWTLEGGINQVLDALASGKVTNYEDPKYSNVRYLSEPDAREILPVQEEWIHKYIDVQPQLTSNPVSVGA